MWQLIWSWQEVSRAREDNEGRVEAQAVVAVQLATGAGAACQAAHSDRERARTVGGRWNNTQHEHTEVTELPVTIGNRDGCWTSKVIERKQRVPGSSEQPMSVHLKRATRRRRARWRGKGLQGTVCTEK